MTSMDQGTIDFTQLHVWFTYSVVDLNIVSYLFFTTVYPN